MRGHIWESGDYMHILLCDDELSSARQLKCYLAEYFTKNKLQNPEYVMFSNGESLLGSNIVADIAFLDVEMPGISGIHVGEYLKQSNPNVIIFIVTAYPGYLDEAMHFQVFRYLSKPVDKNRLFRNMKDALFQYHTLVKKIVIETKEEIISVMMTDIVCIEARDRKVFVYTRQGTYCSVKSISYWIEQLNNGSFFQTHRSFIVNMHYISHFDKMQVYFTEPDITAYLTRRKYKQFKDAYMLYVESMR